MDRFVRSIVPQSIAKPKPLQGVEMARHIATVAYEKKANEIVCLDVHEKVDYTDFLVICEGTSDRHVQAIAQAIGDELRSHKMRPIGVEGEQLGQWILMDCGDVVVHVFHYQMRHVFELEKLWRDAPRVEVDFPSGGGLAPAPEVGEPAEP
ncbi:MAG: ribosome silencing factor [Myxococcales bacterium]|nr:ribosome silencing factor [Myxococcales bacterium]